MNVRIFAASIFLVMSLHAINIDTRIGSAQQFQSYVYPTQQTFNNGDATYGDVEFSAGILFSGFNPTITLGVTPPLSTIIQNNGTINVAHDLILNLDQIAGQVAFNITPNNSIISLNRDLTIPNGGNVFIESITGGIIDGNNHNIILAAGFPVISFTSNPFSVHPSPPPMIIRNVTFTGPSVTTGLSFSELMVLENVGVLALSAAFPIEFEGAFIFQGQNNILGAGGTFFFFGGFQPNFNYIRVASQSRLYISPNSTLQFEPNAGLGFYFDDQSSQLYLDNCTLDLFPASTLTWTAGTVLINGIVTIQTAGKAALQIGDGASRANNCELIILPGSKLVIDTGITFSNMNV